MIAGPGASRASYYLKSGGSSVEQAASKPIYFCPCPLDEARFQSCPQAITSGINDSGKLKRCSIEN